jgi:hypothetical protein
LLVVGNQNSDIEWIAFDAKRSILMNGIVEAKVAAEETKQPGIPSSPWREVMSWKGVGVMNTELFQIVGKQWRINWESKGDVANLLQIFIYDEDNELVNLTANAVGSASDTSYVHNKGTYYLTINAANSEWSVSVEEESVNGTVGSVIPEKSVFIKNWKGIGIKTTEKFEIGDGIWRIDWKVASQEYGLLQLFIYNDKNELIGLVGNSNQSGYSYVYTESGNYYIQISSANLEWDITVSEFLK